MAEILEPPLEPSAAAEVITRRLRPRYADVQIAIRSSLAGFSEDDSVWYVYPRWRHRRPGWP